jgi:hypothetical protein
MRRVIWYKKYFPEQFRLQVQNKIVQQQIEFNSNKEQGVYVLNYIILLVRC